MKIAYPNLQTPTQVEVREKQIHYEQVLKNKVAEVLDKQTQTEEFKYLKELGSNVDLYA